MNRENPLPVVHPAQLDDTSCARRWLIDSLWAASGVGILGGAPKCGKSWLALDMALSVATETPCLDRFAVCEPGAVLLYMAEDSPAHVKARLLGLCTHRGLDLESAPIHLITAPTLRLDLQRDQDRLRDTIDALRPRLMVLDPFVRLHRIDENNAGEVSQLLAYLRSLQRHYDLAICVVHHARKNGGGSAGVALRGSGDFYAWVDSGLYLRRLRGALVLTAEHRSAPAPDPIKLDLVSSERATHLAIAAATEPTPSPDLEDKILAALTERTMTRPELRETLRVRNQRVGVALERLLATSRVIRDGNHWAIPVPTP